MSIKVPERWNRQKLEIAEVIKKLTKWIDIFEFDYQAIKSGQVEQMEKLVDYYKSLLHEADKNCSNEIESTLILKKREI